MAVEYEGGVIIAADSRTSTGVPPLCCSFCVLSLRSSGSYVANRVSDKLSPLSEKIYVARSGSASDTQAIADMVKYYLAMHSIELGEQPTVKSASALVQQMCYFNKNDLLAGMIVAGAL